MTSPTLPERGCVGLVVLSASRRIRSGWEQCGLRLLVCCGAEAVVLRLAWHAEQHEQPDASDDGDEADPVPLTAFAHVVKTAPGDGQAWEKKAQPILSVDWGANQIFWRNGRERKASHAPL